MLKSALVALDGSPASQAVQAAAFALAKSEGYALTGLGVLDAPAIRDREMVPPGGAAFELEEIQLKEAGGKIAAFLKAFAEGAQAAGVQAATSQAEGEPSEQIALAGQAHDLILIGQETRFHFETQDREHDTYRELVRSASRPVLAIPPAGAPSEGDVLVAFDGSPASARALHLFYLSGIASGRRALVVSIAERRAEAAETAARGARFLSERGRQAEPLPIESDAAIDDLLLAEIARIKPAMLVMGCFGHRGLKEIFFGSTTMRLLFERPCPANVFLYH